MTIVAQDSKHQAETFLAALHKKLQEELLEPALMRGSIEELVREAKVDKTRTEHGPEYAFLNHYAVPIIFNHMCSSSNLTSEEVRDCLFSEWYRGLPQYHNKSPARHAVHSHPFDKSLPEATRLVRRWRGLEPNGSGGFRKPLHQGCPDLAIGGPYPFRIVFEVKYFRPGDNPEVQLTKSLYETFYYLSLPPLPEMPPRPAWDYQYGCFLAFDASDAGSLEETWNSLAEEARVGFWENGNIFVMIVRPKAN